MLFSFNLNLNLLKAFCLITLLQCSIEIGEQIENFIRQNEGCTVESYDAIISLLQFIFSCAQFLFVFLKGNVINYITFIFQID
jgi:hypothetical protein